MSHQVDLEQSGYDSLDDAQKPLNFRIRLEFAFGKKATNYHCTDDA